jgi:hypothetical protein
MSRWTLTVLPATPRLALVLVIRNQVEVYLRGVERSAEMRQRQPPPGIATARRRVRLATLVTAGAVAATALVLVPMARRLSSPDRAPDVMDITGAEAPLN